ncbi:MAG: DMT family transporter [Gammaproteobacteria bacterium]
MKYNLFLGVSLAILSTFFYSGLNAMIKVHAADISIPMLVFIQSLMALMMFTPILFKNGIRSAKKIVATNKLQLHILRTVLSLLVSYLLFSAVKFIPLVNAMLLTNSAPLLVPLVAYVFLAQKINHRFWIPILVGFAGIALVLQPDSRIFHPAALLALASALFLAATIVSIRRLAATESSETITFYFFILSTLISGVVALLFWEPFSLSIGIILLMGVIYFISQYLYNIALCYANAQLVGSLLYMNIINSTVISAVVWDLFPSTLTLLGICMTALGGIMCIRVEHQSHKRETKTEDGLLTYATSN